VSNHNVPLFDLLKGQNSPYEGFGDVLPDQVENKELIDRLTSEAAERIKEGFGIELSDTNQAVTEIENTIAEMWQEGWNPDEGNVNLFATDFGLVLVELIQQLYAGKTVFRSTSELNHLSIWWSEKGVEVFPFHKAYKRLTLESGENLSSFVQGLKHILEEG
jgi:hypothetical protein